MGVKYPFGIASVPVIGTTGVVSITIDNTKTYVAVTPTAEITALDLVIDSEVPIGSELFIIVSQGGTGFDVTPNTGFRATSPVLTGVLNDVDVLEFIYDGAVFVPKAADWAKIIDAA